MHSVTMVSSNPLKTVDVSEINAEAGKELVEAAISKGFLMVEGHGFSQKEVDDLFELCRDFFACSFDYKSKYARDDTNHGYVSSETLDPQYSKKPDPKEALNISGLDFTSGKACKPLPDCFDAEKSAFVESVILRLFELSRTLLEILALGLEIKDTPECPGQDWFNKRYDPVKKSSSTFRLLHYPSQKNFALDVLIRAGAHTDYGSMTLLFQRENEEGLEIYAQNKWQPVPFVAGTSSHKGEAPPIIVNVGDLLSFWTGGLLKSTVHRVKFPPENLVNGRDRYSIVFFSHPNDDALLEPVPSDIVQSKGDRGANRANVEGITARQHLEKRFVGTYV